MTINPKEQPPLFNYGWDNFPAAHIEHSCQIDPGFSGGPLILRRRGSLLGINTFVFGRGGNYAITVEGALAGLRDLRTGRHSWQLTHQALQPEPKSTKDVIQKLVSQTRVVDAE